MITLGAFIQDPADLPCGKVDVSTLAGKIIKHEVRELFDAYLSQVEECRVKDLGELVRQVAFQIPRCPVILGSNAAI